MGKNLSKSQVRRIWITVIIVTLVFIGFYILSIVNPLISYLLNRPYVILPSEGVLAVCQQLHLEVDEDFCITPENQNIRTFEDALNRAYPTNNTNYMDLVQYLNIYPSTPSFSCPQDASIDWREYQVNNCPALENCRDNFFSENQSCTFRLSLLDNTELTVHFDSDDGVIRDYSLAIPSETVID